MVNFSRPRRMGVTCSVCNLGISARSEEIPRELNPDGTCPLCNKTIIPMDEGQDLFENYCMSHQITTPGRFRCSCGWISLIE